ncbi:FAD:protein FMN transferase [Thiospirochaeta perfilievii]|uniref:FAD:protein FMN transferase n=1 Tax=Thiospirochaeta perfilievii TaxID=252967 RepID=A0A5C1Q859_9SPIO|nr:FAD:protein FMN transferase [Thiospirochaeta perfilievii]QEN03518.1 FAD:protein FMN transferase [Thiospirochaeta perfilievii]
MRLIKIYTFITIFLLLGCEKKDVNNKPVSDTKFILGTFVTINIWADNSRELLDGSFDILLDIEKKMSVNIDSSDVSQINLNAGISPVELTNSTLSVIKKGLYYGDLSNGLFDISIGPLVKLWKIGSGGFEVPDIKDINKRIPLVNYKNIKIDQNSISMDKGMSIDLGGIAKGYAADIVAEYLVQNGVDSGIINLGGNVKLIGNKPNGSDFIVGIQNPFDNRNSYLGTIELKNKSIISSGDYERYFEVDGKRYHHIINRVSGFPAVTDVSSVTVITDKGIDGDALSTIFFQMDIDSGLELAKKIGGVYVIYITKDSKIYLPKEMKENFKLINTSFSLVFK